MMMKILSRFLMIALVAEARLDGPPSPAFRENHEHEESESRIVGGSAADRGEYPYFVSWGGCAASLVAEDVILSAAHCSGIRSNSVIVGAYQRWWGQTSGDAERRSISELESDRRRHPDYNGSTFENDFLVMKLTEPVTHIEPVSLNGDEDTPIVDDIVTAIGFGAVFEGGWGPRLLQEVDVKYVSHEQCNDEYDGDIVKDVMLCAGVPGGGKDSCQGDSGGPLVMKSPNGDHVQVGVVSWGYGCARGGYSGVYSRVSGAKEWIDQQICELSDYRCNGSKTNSAATSSPVSSTNSQTSSTAAECNDSETDTFHIDATYGMQGCSWLQQELDEYGYLCKFVDVATTCPSLCNICDLIE